LKDLEALLNNLVGYKVAISFTPHEEDALRETEGILEDFNEEVIHLRIYDSFGDCSDYYLNRHACTLHSITDFGKEAVKLIAVE
jgi:chromosome segregation ATPase